MPSARVVEALNTAKDVGTGSVAGAVDLLGRPFVLGEEKKLAIAELSQTLPARLIKQVMLLSAGRR